MFVQCNVDQSTDHCAAMHVKGWLFCWLSKHNSPVEFSQGLTQSLRKTPIYETIRVSEDISFSLLYTAGDHKTTVVLGCDPRSSEAMSTFNRTLEWAKLNELSLEISPNITGYDEQTRHLLAELGSSTAYSGALEAALSKVMMDKSAASDNPGDKLYIGMSFDEIVRLLGKPSGINPGTEMLEVGPGSIVVASERTRARLARTQYCMWKRPEGEYLLTIEDGKLANIYSKPEMTTDFRLVMALSRAVQEKFKDNPPEMTAAVMLAMTDKKREDLVERPEGIYLSKQCADRISSYEVWLTDDGEIIVTRKRVKGRSDAPKEDSQRFLTERLPKARKLGVIDLFQYALGLAITFGLEQDRLLVKKDQKGMAIF